MSDAVKALAVVNIVAFVALGVATLRQFRRRRDAASGWALAAFGCLALVVLLAIGLPKHPHGAEAVRLRFVLAVLVVFPYLLFRFTLAFGPAGHRLARLVGSLTAALVIWSFALQEIPATGDPWPASWAAYVVVFLLHWTLLSVVCSWRLWRAGRKQPTVARRRMQFLALAASTITVALLVSAGSRSDTSVLALVSGVLATVSALAFLLGLAAPRVLRIAWRRPEEERLQGSIASLMALATTQEEAAARVVEPMASMVGARAIAIRNAEGRVVGTFGVGPEGIGPAQGEQIQIEARGATLTVWTSPYAPFFGDEELRLLEVLGALTGLALDRVRLYAQEHDARLALERANELQANFIALAAHELRTPVTTIYGFVRTLNHLGDRLSEEQREELSRTLEQQTQRMALLVEQLLDLSRLDADAIEIMPRRFDVRGRLDEIVAIAAGDRVEHVEVTVGGGLEVNADPHAFDRIVSNLVTNALRYGAPPVTIEAFQSDRHFRLVVEDRGRGVPPEFVPSLFERFARSDAAHERGPGTGLGLAIARSYARAHDGDLVYERAEPSGARFKLVLPAHR